jgi:hypothetical protein
MGFGVLGLAMGLLVLSVPLTAHAQEQTQPEVVPADAGRGKPDGYHRETRLRLGPLIGGGIATGIGGMMLYTGLEQRAELSSNPVQQAPGSGGEFFIVAGTLSLVVGVPLLIYGLVSPRAVYVRNQPVSVSFGYSPKRHAGAVALVFEL